MTVSGDAGCAAYGEARLSLPVEALNEAPRELTAWVVVDLDERMTATCR